MTEQTLRTFQADLIILFELVNHIDQEYGSIDPSFDKDSKKFSGFLNMFNKKYRDIYVKSSIVNDRFRIKIYLKEKTLKDFYENCASKIPNLVAVGTNTFKPLPPHKTPLDIAEDNHELTCFYRDMFEDSYTIRVFFRKKGYLEMKYLTEEIDDIGSPNFRVCAYYALKKPDFSIDLKKAIESFSFDVRGTSRRVGEMSRL